MDEPLTQRQDKSVDLLDATVFELGAMAFILGLVLWLLVSQIIHWERVRRRERMPHWQRRAMMDEDPRRGFDVIQRDDPAE